MITTSNTKYKKDYKDLKKKLEALFLANVVLNRTEDKLKDSVRLFFSKEGAKCHNVSVNVEYLYFMGYKRTKNPNTTLEVEFTFPKQNTRIWTLTHKS
jgi:hypothetical protein